MKKTCTFPECDREYSARGFCATHLTQLRRGRELKPVHAPLPSCSFTDCGRPHNARGYCHTHWQQLKRGYELKPIKVTSATICYAAAHDRLRAARGKASTYACVDNCGRMATEYSLDDHNHPDNLTCVQSTTTYSLDLDRYAPRCRSCHRLHDAA